MVRDHGEQCARSGLIQGLRADCRAMNNSVSQALPSAVTAKQLVDLARKHIEDQQSRIVR